MLGSVEYGIGRERERGEREGERGERREREGEIGEKGERERTLLLIMHVLAPHKGLRRLTWSAFLRFSCSGRNRDLVVVYDGGNWLSGERSRKI